MVAENHKLAARKRDEALRRARERTRTIAGQSQAILELSIPVMDFWGKILVLPLVGTIDTQRAELTTENLLEAIARTRALAVIVDITGVPVVDTSVASHLQKLIEASRSLGSEVILTGIGPRNARTLVELGVDLGKVVAMSSLGSGLAAALDIVDSEVVRKAG